MSREVHVRFSESARVKFPRATQLQTFAVPQITVYRKKDLPLGKCFYIEFALIWVISPGFSISHLRNLSGRGKDFSKQASRSTSSTPYFFNTRCLYFLFFVFSSIRLLGFAAKRSANSLLQVASSRIFGSHNGPDRSRLISCRKTGRTRVIELFHKPCFVLRISFLFRVDQSHSNFEGLLP